MSSMLCPRLLSINLVLIIFFKHLNFTLMKKVLINTRILAIALGATFATAFSSPALATEEKKAIPVELKFVGNIESQPVFLLSFNNADESGYTIVVRDEFNNVLYRDNVKGGNITKKFLLNTEEL